MTVVTANDAPTIQIGMKELIDQNSRGLAILFAESIALRASSAPGENPDSENVARETIAQHRELIAEVVKAHAGQVIKMMGASVIAEFADLAAAVHAAATMQRLSLESSETSTHQESIHQSIHLGLRIGIEGLVSHSESMDLFGAAVHAATTITKHAAPGQILVSQKVCDALGTETDLHLQWFRTVGINGQGDGEDIFEVHWMPAIANIPSRYEALFQVGAGGMGIVYKARDRETGEIVALKILRSEIASDPAMQENLRREVRLARKVTHKNVCRIHEFNRSNGMACISMEFVEGASLHCALQRNGAVPWDQALKIALQLCAGLGEAHAQGIVHRDLKPANIMMDRSGVAKIMDFGIARSFQGTSQMTGTLVGTPAYMAPEQVELKSVDARTDVYALGLLLYEIVTGSQAFAGDTPIAVAVKQLREFPKRPREIVSNLPAHAEAVILTCLEKDPAKRFQSMDELAAALNINSQIKYATTFWGTFIKDFRGYGQALRAHLEAQLRALDQLWRKQDWESLIRVNKRMQKGLAVGLGVACLLGIVAFTVRSKTRNHGADSASMGIATPAAAQSPLAPVPETVVAGDAGVLVSNRARATVTWSHQVELDSNSESGSQNPPSQNLQSPTDASFDSSGKKISLKKSSPAIKIAALSAAKAKASGPQGTVQAKVSLSSSESLTAASTGTAASSEENLEDVASDSGASRSAAVAPAAAPVAAEVVEKSANNGAAPTSRYLDVGSFKESAWADQAVEKLTQLGFHATSIRKNLLWVQSYQVRVGPYTDITGLETAKQSLVAQGFKPHPVK